MKSGILMIYFMFCITLHRQKSKLKGELMANMSVLIGYVSISRCNMMASIIISFSSVDDRYFLLARIFNFAMMPRNSSSSASMYIQNPIYNDKIVENIIIYRNIARNSIVQAA